MLTKAIWADKNGLVVSGRLACTSSKTEISNNHSIFTDNMETKQLKEFEVSERISIKKFVEGIGFDFVKGNAFYQLTKKETIQDYKNIVAKRKFDGCMVTGTVYTLGQ